MAAFFTDPIYSFKDENVLFTVGSKTVAKSVKEEQKAFNQWLNKKGFISLTFNYSIDAAKVQKYKVFTPKQEFEKLAEDYPDLLEFAKRFNLTFDE
jgi:hypothetical protein